MQPEEADLYDYVRLEDIDSYNDAAGMERIQIISADGPSDYMRPVLNAMDEKNISDIYRISFVYLRALGTGGGRFTYSRHYKEKR